MAIDNLSQKISELSQRLEELQAKCVNNPEYAPEVLADALESLQASLEELSAADEELMQQNDELMQIQLALQKSAEKFRLVADFTYDWETWIDPKGNYVYVSPSCERITGYYAEEFIENHSLSIDIIHPDDKEAFKQHQNVHFDEQTDSAQIDYRIITTKGEIRWISHICQPVFGRNGEWLGSRASNRDITERKQAEEALHANEKRLQAVLAGMTDAYYFYDREWRFVDINPRAVEYFGRPREELLGRNVWELYPHTVGGKPWTEYHRAMAEGVPVHFETQSGVSPRFFEVHAYPEPEGLAVYLRDITERKRMEGALQEKQEELEVQAEELEAQNEELRINNEDLAETTKLLQESEARFRATYEQAAVGIEMLNLDGRFLRGNAMLSEILGYSQKELQCLNFADITYPDDLVRELPLLEDLLARQIGHYTIEKRYLRKDGQDVWVRVTSSLANVQEPYRISIIEDITERKKVEEALRTSDARLNKAIETVREGVIIATEAEDVIYWNPAAQALHGFTRPREGIEPLSDTPKTFDLIYPDTGLVLPLEDWPMKRIKRGEKVSNLELLLRRPDQGWVKYVSYSGTMVETSNAEHLIFLTVYDITERKQMEEGLRKSRDELEQRVQERTSELSDAKENLEVINEELQVEISEHEKTEKDLLNAKEAAEAAVEAKAAFLANMSHELRTPLNAVLGFSSLLMEDNLTEDQKEYVERIRIGGESLLALIGDVLEFSRAEKERIKLEHQPLSLKVSIEESLDMVAVQADKKGLKLAYTINYGTPDTIIGDPGRLRQILVNLLSNAVKFTDEGEISVSVSSKVIEGNKRRITFAVSDTGIGMPLDKMDRLFQPFTQLEYTLSRKRDGAGLGLAICKELVELMGGEIWAESEEGKGSTFRFTIQAETISGKQLDLGEKNKAAIYENLSAKKPLSILVAEDNPSNQKVLVEMLKRLGYRADAVADGCEVLQALQIRPYDLIFMDIQMPELDGITATKEIRKIWPENGPKVVAITAFAMDGDQEKCLEAGMDGYIAKPVKVDDLATLLRNITPPPRIKFRR